MNKTLTTKDEIKLLRSALIGILGKDKEGGYKAQFVREIFSDLKRRPTHTFVDAKTFLDEIAKTR